MASAIVIGGGVVGLGTALMLAGAGHEVTVLERDPEVPSGDPEQDWERWQRQGVTQFRLPHYLLARVRQVLESELPAVAAELTARGALRIDFPVGDGAFTLLTARRPVVEGAFAAVAADDRRLEVRRGEAVAGLLTGASVRAGVPHVTGVRTASGESVTADLVLDVSGRRSALPRWLGSIGARPLHEEADDSGFVYYGRHFRSPDGSLPKQIGPPNTPLGTISSLALPADNGTWSLVLVANARDKALYPLRRLEVWERVVTALPNVADWVDGTPIDDGVQSIARIEDRRRSLVVDGAPVVTGLVAVGDAWSCTNPSVGRGVSIGLMQAQLLGDVLVERGLDDPWSFCEAFHEATAERVEPWYGETLAGDRHRLAEIQAGIAGGEYRPADPAYEAMQALSAAAALDPVCLHALLPVAMVLERESEVVRRPGLAERAAELGGDWRERPVPAPGREKLLALVAG